MINSFETGKWYRWIGPKERPEGGYWLSKMDQMLDGKPRVCTKGNGDYANFEGIEPFYQNHEGQDGMWIWYNLENFEEVDMSSVPVHGVKYWVSDGNTTPDSNRGEWLYVGTTSNGETVFERPETTGICRWKNFTPAKVQLTTEEALRACIERLEAVGDTSDLITNARKALGE